MFVFFSADVSEVQQKEEKDVAEMQQVEQEGSRGEKETTQHSVYSLLCKASQTAVLSFNQLFVFIYLLLLLIKISKIHTNKQ